MAERPTTTVELSGGQVEYRLVRRGDPVVVVFHGGHMRAGLTLDERVYAEANVTVLAPSRPGYGRTPITTGTTVSGFADVTAELCRHLGIDRIVASVGISAGGPSAVALAARHPELVERLITQAAVGPLPYPDRRTRLLAGVMFSPHIEGLTWGGMRAGLRRSPDLVLRKLLAGLSTLQADQVLAELTPEQRTQLVWLFSRMRSGAGFRNDLRPHEDLTAQVTQPTLVIASRRDGALPFAHAEALSTRISRAELVESQADHHFYEFAADWPALTATIRAFLAADPAS
ncbi:alpha/beta fold hydrolase [Micromonospora endophytica]|uniref:Alpha/beta hydrolase n=1 Tax=Micromonospora endophytica TaxID=515350 RepID=A0A2W2CX03_9ACTN|nr:alpha/beta hydrolase [Micromonospora endophytica]PZF97834.1 alpha/beta hydrolase [Micromonospora endophytica]RIW43260.1 alpha/beta hydrolase [Micromonospora endophytica]BCJ61500.1 putative hydrolase YcgS [Micromonospora endophytica]